MRHVVAIWVKLVLVGELAGCGYPPLPNVPREVVVFPTVPSRDVDILFLIDDSPSMADKQANLADNFLKFIEVLESIPGSLPNVHIGVATSDMGTQAALDPNFGPAVGAGAAGGCSGLGKDGALQTFGAPVTGPYIVDIADPATGTRMRNYTGDLATVFGQIAIGAGARGCGFEQHLAAVKRALTNPANNGFLRPNAYLAVILIADEDDCSLAHYSLLAADASSSTQLGDLESFRCTRFGVLCNQGGQDTNQMNQVGAKGQCHPTDSTQYLANVNDTVTFLKGLKSDPSKVIVAGIVGTTDPFAVELRTPPSQTTAIPALAHSCSYTDRNNQTEVADPPIRIKAFLDQFPNRSTFVPICQNDLSGGLQQIGDLLKTTIGDPCIDGKLVNFAKPGDPPLYDCSVIAATAPDASTGTALPRCTPENGAATNQPCWHIVAPDPMKCSAGATYMLQIEGGAQLDVPGVYVIASCVAPAMSPGP